MSLIDIIGFGVSSIIMVVLSKSRMHMRSRCWGYTYNDHHNVDISKLNEEKENESVSDVDDEDLPIDSFKTLPPPPPPKIPALPLSRMNLNPLHGVRWINNYFNYIFININIIWCCVCTWDVRAWASAPPSYKMYSTRPEDPG